MPHPSLFDPPFESNAPTLAALPDTLRNLTDDPLAHAGTNIVIARGNPQSRILLIARRARPAPGGFAPTRRTGGR